MFDAADEENAAFVDHAVTDAGPPGRPLWRYALHAAVSGDGGASWTPLGEIDSTTHATRGIWEPVLFRHSGGGPIQVYYALERSRAETCGGKDTDAQDIVVKESSDGGASWGARRVALRRGGSREGVPSVVETDDGAMLIAFETWMNADCAALEPRLTVGLARSRDKGRSWSYLPNALTPQGDDIADGWPALAKLPDGRVLLKFSAVRKPKGAEQSDEVRVIWTTTPPTGASSPRWSESRLVFANRRWGFPLVLTPSSVMFSGGGPKGVQPLIRVLPIRNFSRTD